MNGRGWLVALGTLIATTVCAGSARAVEPINELIPHLIEQGGWLRAHYPGQPQDKQHPSFFARTEPADTPDLLGNEPHIAIVARDWREAYSLTDGRALLFDRVRLIRSSRMAVTRLSLSGGRFLPYAELSFGQWRADVDLVPWLKNDTELAGQVALGFEMRLAPRCAVAWDLEETQIYPDKQANVPATRLMASFMAMRAEF